MKALVTQYTFDKTAKTVTLTGHSSVDLAGLLLITNVTDGQIIYNFADPSIGATVSGNVVTLEYDTSSMDNSDDLQIFYDDGSTVQEVEVVLTLKQILQALQNPPHMDKSQNRIRETAVIESGTVTTVTTVSNLTNVGTQPADALYRLTSQNTWANVQRRTIS